MPASSRARSRPVRVIVHDTRILAALARAPCSRSSAAATWRPGAELPHRLPHAHRGRRDADTHRRASEVHARPCAAQWGVIANLYAVRSDANWGVGDITDLATIAEWSGEKGAVVRRSESAARAPQSRPRHLALQPDQPALSQSDLHRRHRGARAQRVHGRARAARRSRHAGRHSQRCARARASSTSACGSLKRRALEMLHRTFIVRHRDARSARGRDYRAYIEHEGAALVNFATFCALEDHFLTSSPRHGWPHWPAELQHPDSPDVVAFRAANTDAVDFHRWLQFELDRQLAAAATHRARVRARHRHLSGSRDRRGSRQRGRLGVRPSLPARHRAWARRPMATRRRDRTGDCRPSIRARSSRIATRSGSRSSARRSATPARSASITCSASSASSGFRAGMTGAHGAYVRFPTEDMLGHSRARERAASRRHRRRRSRHRAAGGAGRARALGNSLLARDVLRARERRPLPSRVVVSAGSRSRPRTRTTWRRSPASGPRATSSCSAWRDSSRATRARPRRARIATTSAAFSSSGSWPRARSRAATRRRRATRSCAAPCIAFSARRRRRSSACTSRISWASASP